MIMFFVNDVNHFTRVIVYFLFYMCYTENCTAFAIFSIIKILFQYRILCLSAKASS